MDFVKDPGDGFTSSPDEMTNEKSETAEEELCAAVPAPAGNDLLQSAALKPPPDGNDSTKPIPTDGARVLAPRCVVIEEVVAGETAGEASLSGGEGDPIAVSSEQPLPPVSSLGRTLRPQPSAASYSFSAQHSGNGQLLLFSELEASFEERPAGLHANTSTVVVQPSEHSARAGLDARVAEDRSWSFFQEAKSLARDIVFAVIAAVLIVWFVVQPVKVQGTSMLPELKDGERIFVNKFIYNFGTIERSDIVVFWYPKDPEKSFIKRVIGLPGDEVRIDGGHVYVNGRLYREPYLDPEHTRMPMTPMTVRVEEHHYFVLGDNRDASNDSRTWGLVPEKYIYGKAMFRYWPMEDFGPIKSEGYE